MESMGAARGREYVLTLSCPDKPGIVYAVASFLVQHSANILASQQYGEPGRAVLHAGALQRPGARGDLARGAPDSAQRRPDRGLPLTHASAGAHHGDQCL